MRIIFFLFLLAPGADAYAQFILPPYKIVRDSLAHITVFHSGNSEKIKPGGNRYSDTLSMISPDIRIKNGIVDHKGLTGDMYVREYYLDSVMIGYIEYDGSDMQREIYFNQNGDVFLEKRYDKGALVYTEERIRTFSIKKEATKPVNF